MIFLLALLVLAVIFYFGYGIPDFKSIDRSYDHD